MTMGNVITRVRDRYRRIETRLHAGRIGRWSARRRWVVFVLVPMLVLCCCGGVVGVPVLWLAGETVEAGQGQPAPDAAANAYLMALSYATEDGLLPLLDDDRQGELLAQWRAYRDAMKGTDPAPFRLSFGALTVGPKVDGRAEVRTDVTAVWWSTDAHGRVSGYESEALPWTFQTRDADGWRSGAVDTCGSMPATGDAGRRSRYRPDMAQYNEGQRVRAVKTIHRSAGSAWSGETGKIVRTTGDGYVIRWDSGGWTAETVKDNEIESA